MRSPALALAWHLWRPHRWGIATFLAYLLGLCVTAHALAADRSAADVREMVGIASMPLLVGLLYLMAVFAYPDADVAATRSGYPAYLLLLPVRTRDLVLWPMLCGTTAVAWGWIALARFVFLPMGLTVPTVWPAAMIAALLAVFQALFWSPLGLPYLRIILALILMPALLALGYWGGILHGLSPAALVALFLGLIPLAYWTATAGLARARHGVSDRSRSPALARAPRRAQRLEWYRRLLWRPAAVDPRSPGRTPFASPARAQLWYEWRCSGLVLPLIVAAAAFFFSLPLIWVREQAPLADLLFPPLLFAPGIAAIQANICLKGQQYALLVPPLFALIVGCGRRKYDRRKRDLALPPFFATRPVTSGDLALAQWKMAVLSTLAAWGVLLLAVGAWLLLPAREGTSTGPLIGLLLRHGTVRGALTLLLGLAGLVGWTWKSQVQTLFIDLTHRPWAVCGYPFALAGSLMALLLLAGASHDRELFLLVVLFVPLLSALVALRAWIVCGYPVGAAGLTLALLLFLKIAHTSQEEILALREPLPALAGFALLLKLLAAAATLLYLRRRGLIEAPDLAKWLAPWLAAAAVLFALLRWLDSGDPVPPAFLAVGVLLLLPLNQLALAPLALAANRHR